MHRPQRFSTKKRTRIHLFQRMGTYIKYMKFAQKLATSSEDVHELMIDKLGLVENQHLNYERLNVEKGLADMNLDEWEPRGSLRLWSGQQLGTLRGWWRRLRGNMPVNKDHHQEGDVADSAIGLGNGTAHVSQATSEAAARMDLIPPWFRPRNKTIEKIRRHTHAYLEEDLVNKKIEKCAENLVKSRRDRVEADHQRWERTCFSLWYQCSVRKCPYAETHFEKKEDMEAHLLNKHSDKFSDANEEERIALKAALKGCRFL